MTRVSCPHRGSKAKCIKCSPDNFCIHKTIQKDCKQCNRCVHNLFKSDCNQCSSHLFCIHSIKRLSCQQCLPHLYCQHQSKIRYCRSCNLCQHFLYKEDCSQCCPHLYCPHKIRKFKCLSCNTTNTRWIYVLELQHSCYYIGCTNDVEKRYQEHLRGQGTDWTRLHNPIRIDKIVEKSQPFDEDCITKEYMMKYDIDKVRGGSYCNMELMYQQKDLLHREICTAYNLCFHCKKAGHFSSRCPNKRIH
jgi:predicted GIY-YIG superfamily endonuclease